MNLKTVLLLGGLLAARSGFFAIQFPACFQSRFPVQGQKLSALPLKDPKNVDRNRADIGLKPLYEYVKILKIDWNAAEFEKQQSQN